jgi:hypothetical protein
MTRRDPEPRMLTQAQAADYCGIGLKAFKSVCPIVPTLFRDGLARYDRCKLDNWLDGLGCENAEVVAVDWVAKLRASSRVGK